jgi:hypothetical protein
MGEPVLLVGHSMGAQVAELVAAAHPEQVVGLVLVSPVALGGADLPDEQLAHFATLAGRPDAQRALRQQLSVALDSETLERLVHDGEQLSSEAVAGSARAWNSGDPTGLTPSAFPGPVLIVRGEEDPFVTQSVLETGVLPRFPGARVVSLPKAGHWPQLERAAAFGALLREFRRALPQRAGDEATRTQGTWRGAFAHKSGPEFAAALALDVTLHATVLVRPVHGRDAVSTVLGAGSSIYAELEFTHQADDGNRTFLEWRAVTEEGDHLAGITVLVHDAEGRIVEAKIHHRPLLGALRFAAELKKRVGGRVDASHFVPTRTEDAFPASAEGQSQPAQDNSEVPS